MYFVVQLDISQATFGGTLVVAVVQQAQWVGTGLCVGSTSLTGPVPIAVETVAVVTVNGLGRIEEGCCTYCARVGETGICDRTFHVDIHTQVVLEEFGT